MWPCEAIVHANTNNGGVELAKPTFLTNANDDTNSGSVTANVEFAKPSLVSSPTIFFSILIYPKRLQVVGEDTNNGSVALRSHRSRKYQQRRRRTCEAIVGVLTNDFFSILIYPKRLQVVGEDTNNGNVALARPSFTQIPTTANVELAKPSFFTNANDDTNSGSVTANVELAKPSLVSSPTIFFQY